LHKEQFIAYLKFEKRYSPNTILAYQKDLYQFGDFLLEQFDCNQIHKATHSQIRSWLAELKLAGIESRSINRKISTLKSFYKYLHRLGHIKKSPTANIISPKTKKRLPVFVNESDIQALLKESDFGDDLQGQTNWLILELLYQTGMRRSELIELKLNRVDVKQRQLQVLGKGNKERIIPISQELAQSISTYLPLRLSAKQLQSDHLLVLKSGKALYPKYVYNVVTKYLGQYTTLSKRSPHILRHTFATHLLNNGAELNAVKELLGHASLAATQVYTHNSIEKLKNIHKKAHPKS
jgi:integrase/recombinase XerC